MGMVRTVAHNIIGLVFPSRCHICESPLDPSSDSPLCLEHLRDIVWTALPVCSKCGRKMFGRSVEALVCAKCRSMSIYYDAGYSACRFADPVKELIHRFKYGKRRYLSFFLGGLLLDYLRERADVTCFDAIVPVPLHWWRYYRRGFNQAADLAKPLSKHFRIPIMKRNLRRVRYTSPQVGLSPQERRANIRNAFRVAHPPKMEGKKLLLVDDVITSGATLNECARVLKKAGATEVTIITLAHPSDVAERDSTAPLVGLPVQIANVRDT